jgi:spore coat protein CotF
VRNVPDILEAVKNVVQALLDDETKLPLHVGEVMSFWSFLSEIADEQIHSEAGINSTTDPELRKAYHETVKMLKSQKERITTFLRLEGVPLPPLSESKPISDPNQVPLGVKLTDDELANSISIKMYLGISYCATAINESVRTDVSLIWIEFLQEYMMFGANMKALLKKRGWLKVPPLYYPPGSPSQ